MSIQYARERLAEQDASLIVDAARALFEDSPVAFAVTQGEKHRVAYANPAFRALTGTHPVALGKPLHATAGAPALLTLLDRAVLEGEPSRDQLVAASGAKAMWTCSVWPLEDAAGHRHGAVVQVEVAENPRMELQRQVAERLLLGALREMDAAAEAREAQERAQFLAEAGRELAASVDEGATRASVSALHLPGPCTWCIVDVIEHDGSLCRLAIIHPDPTRRGAARALENAWKPQPDDRFGAPAILRKPDPVAIVSNVSAVVEQSAGNETTLQALQQLGIGSLLTVPMQLRGKILGAITFVGGTRRRTYSLEELELAQALALRGAVALDNARLYGEALELKDKALEGSRAKSEFLARMSHELRTPLNAIAGFVDIIDMEIHGPVTGDQRSDLARIRASQEHLLFMINDILSYMTISRGKTDYHPVDLPVRERVMSALELIEPLLKEKQLTMAEPKCSADVWVRADPDRVQQILVNLLTNAVKYTPEGGLIGIDCESAGDVARVTVWDSGIGVAADRLESIFEPFVQETSGYSDRAGGVGLGLAISRDLARAMGGSIIAESRPGGGSRFTITLPRARAFRLPDQST